MKHIHSYLRLIIVNHTIHICDLMFLFIIFINPRNLPTVDSYCYHTYMSQSLKYNVCNVHNLLCILYNILFVFEI